jgi:hypothetical protein
VKCKACGQTIIEGEADHHLVRSPIFPDVCLGCWIASLELEKFLLRATGHTPLGNWTQGWLREIISDPTRYR